MCNSGIDLRKTEVMCSMQNQKDYGERLTCQSSRQLEAKAGGVARRIVMFADWQRMVVDSRSHTSQWRLFLGKKI